MKKFSLLALVAITIAMVTGCKPECYYDPINGHPDIIKTKIVPGTRVLFLGDSVTDEMYLTKTGLGSWVNWFAEYADITAKNIAICGSTYSLYRLNVDGFSIKKGIIEKINLDDYDYIFVAGGVNNIHGVDDVTTSFIDLDYTCKALSKYGDKVIICNPFYFNDKSNDMTQTETTYFRDAIYENAVKYGFSYVDLTKFQYERKDEIHPTALGCIQIALQMYNLFK